MDYQFKAGSIPLLVSMPHVGTEIPDDILASMTPAAIDKQDTDWHLVRLYEFLGEMGASTLSARWSRYVIDLNRPPENTNLYPGQDTTGLCPVDTFHREPLYVEGRVPDEAEVQRRLQAYWKPYHDQLRAELDRLLALHGAVVLWDAHSIASVVPRFFEGKLPDLNFGTADGTSCASGLGDAVVAPALAQQQFSGRRQRPLQGRSYHAPLRQAGSQCARDPAWRCASRSTWMRRARYGYRPDLAAQVQGGLRDMMQAAAGWVRA
jgi:N-formylglutamate deformylase